MFWIVKLLSALHARKMALRVFDHLNVDRLSLKQLRFAIDLAGRITDRQRSKQYARMAVAHFPQNTVGYLALANWFQEEERFDEAKAVIDAAPSAHTVKKMKREIERQRLSVELDHIDAEIPGMQNFDNTWTLATVATGETGTAHGYRADNILEEPTENIQKEIGKASVKIRQNPLNWNAYWTLSKLLLQADAFEQAAKLLIRLPKRVWRNIDYYLATARACEGSGKLRQALTSLLVAQRDFPCDHRILLRISNIYRDTGDWETAYIYTCAAQRIYPKYGTIRKLTFEADHLLIQEGYETLEWIKKFTAAELLKFLPMINRVSVFFPDARDMITDWRDQARKALRINPFRSATHLEKVFKLTVKLRWYEDAQKLLEQGGARGVLPKPETVAWYQSRKAALGSMASLLEIAYLNESGKNLIGIRNHAAIDIYPDDVKSPNVVELFIPTAFFADAEDEKPSYETIRIFLHTVYDHLLAQSDLIIVPRHQYNWRFCKRHLQARAVSYHTNAEFEKNWLHLQEATLAGRCSMDHQGFAGYSSLASGRIDIAGFCRDKNEAELEGNYRTIYETYVGGNISKYAQSTQQKKITGRYVFVALQVSTDIVANLAWIKGEELVRAVAEHYHGTDVKVVVKRHPYCKSIAIETILETLSKQGMIQISTASVHDLIGEAEVVYTVNSGVGLETLMHMKPLVITGASDYMYGVTALAKTLDELQTVMSTTMEVDRRRVLELFYYYTNQYTIPADDDALIKNRLDEWLKIPFA